MSSIVFTKVDVAALDWPESGKVRVAYDLDGVLKQVDSGGVVTTIGGGAVEVTYAELVSSMGADELVAGRFYVISDFRTAYNIFDGGDGTVVEACLGELEPLVVLATGAGSIAKAAYSATYPGDEILYDAVGAGVANDVGFSNGAGVHVAGFKGVIEYRRDVARDVSAWYDFRNVKFRRWSVDAVPYTDSAVYPAVSASYMGKVSGMSSNVVLTATTAGIIGNTIKLTGDGVKKLYELIADWCNANPGNNVSLVSGNGAQVPDMGEAIKLSGGAEGSGYAAGDVCKSGVDGNVYKCVANTLAEGDPYLNTSDWVMLFDLSVDAYVSWTTKNSSFDIGGINTDFLLLGGDYQDVYTFGSNYNYVYSVKIGRAFGYSALNNAVFKTAANQLTCSKNDLGDGFRSSTLGNGFVQNRTGSEFHDNVVGIFFSNNAVGNGFVSNVVGDFFGDNVIGNDFGKNTLGDFFGDNAIGNDFGKNTVGSYFSDNVIGNDFGKNTVGSYFSNNRIGNAFASNTVKGFFSDNVIGNSFTLCAAGDFFMRNVIGDGFTNNRTVGNFNNNSIGHGFYNNTIYEFFTYNIIGSKGCNNRIGDDFTENTIGDNFISNNIGKDFSYNTFANGVNSNMIGNGFYSNKIGVDFNHNGIGANFRNNTAGNNFIDNTIGINSENNSFGNDFVRNIAGNGFASNAILYGFHDNKVGINFSGNSIGGIFAGNVVGEGFGNNAIGNSFSANNIGGFFDSNVIGYGFSGNIIADYFHYNVVEAPVAGIDFSSATHVYLNYTCHIFAGAGGSPSGSPSLSYYNSDVLTVAGVID